MTVDFDILKRNELKAAVELAGRAFEDYEYFTNYFPDLEERRKVLRSVVYREFLTNFKKTHYLVAKAASKREQSDACIDSAEREQARPEVKKNGELVAVVQLNAPDYKKPSDFQYLIHGWPLVYLGVNRQRLDDWLAMDAAAGRPCHEYQATGTGIWYLSSITVDPSAQGIGIGKQFIAYMEDFIRKHGGRELVLFTNSDKNIAYYKRCGFKTFDEREFTYNGRKMRSWSVKKILLTTKIESYNVTKDNETIMDDSRHPDAMRRNRDDLLLQGRRR